MPKNGREPMEQKDIEEGQIKGERERTAKQYRAAMSNGRGRIHEQMIEGACRVYAGEGRAYILKVPEPFRVITKNRGRGIATVQFTAHAQPDFVGILKGGESIAFEAKHTDSGKLLQRVVTATQAAALQRFHDLGGAAAVCAGIGDECFMIPWEIFSHMKEVFGRQYVTAADIAEYKVKFDGVIWFLDYVNKKKQGG